MILKPAVSWIKRNKFEFVLLVGILLLAAFLRLYRIHEFVIFLGDEGRDALVVKRMIVDFDLTLLGPTASVGGFYLGPAYYYMMIPAMILSGLDPVGPAIMVAFMGVGTIGLLYFLVRDWFGQFPAQIAILLYSVFPNLVNFSRSSWNPNPLPLFSLFSIATIHYGVTRKNQWLVFASGLALGIAGQLHHFGLLLCPIVLAVLLAQSSWEDKTFLSHLVSIFRRKQSFSFSHLYAVLQKNHFIKHLLFLAFGFLLGISMYLAFELRHDFMNTKAIIEFINRPGKTTGLRSYNFPWLFYEINRFNFESMLGRKLIPITPAFTYGFLSLLILYMYRLIHIDAKPTKAIVTTLIYWVLGIVGISLYRGQLNFHYFEYLFPAPFLVFAMTLSVYHSRFAKRVITVLALVLSLFLIYKQDIWIHGSNLINQTAHVADEIIKLSEGNEFNFALITPGNSDHAYRFFLEIKNHKPVPLSEKVTQRLIIVCEMEAKDCHPLGHPLWEISAFGRAELIKHVNIQPGLNLYLMEHHVDSLDQIGKPASHG